MMRGCAGSPPTHGAPATSRSNRSWDAASVAATAASSPARTDAGDAASHVRSCIERPRVRCAADRLGRRWDTDGSLRPDRIADASPIRSSRRAAVSATASSTRTWSISQTLGGVAVKGLFLERTRRPPPPADRRDAVRDAERDRPPGHRRAPFVAERLPELRRRRAIVIVNICGTTLDEYVEVARILSDAEGVGRASSSRSRARTSRGRHQVRMQPRRHVRCRQRRPESHADCRHSQADAM